MIEVLLTHFTELIIGLVIAIMGLIFTYLKRKLDHIADTLVNSEENEEGKKHPHPSIGECIKKDEIVYNELFRLLFFAQASRAYVLQFHNGSVFTTNNPIWKFSKSYEICNDGIKAEVDSTQNIMIAHMTQMFAPLYNKEISSSNGVKLIKSDTKNVNLTCPDMDAYPVYSITSDQVSNYYISSFLMNRCIKECIFSPIFDTECNIIGLICLDYCSKALTEASLYDKIVPEMYRVSAKISESI